MKADTRNVVIIGLLFVFVIALGAAAYSPHVRSLHDALSYLMFLREDGTIFAPGFTEAKFDQVKVGMSEAEVSAILGEPLTKDVHREYCYWRYSTGPSEGSYWSRVITFQDAHVTRKHAYYWAD